MPIYDRPVRLLMRDMVSDLKLQKGQTFSKQQVLSWFRDKYPKIKTGTITAHLIRFSINARTRVYYYAKPGEDDLFYQIDGSHFRLYDKQTDPAPIYEAVTPEQTEPSVTPVSEEPDTEEDISTEFAYESDLQNFLAKNLTLIEPGLKLYEDEGITGIEFPVGGRSIDILALDAKNNLVVIELKVSRGHERVAGQLLRYMGWIKKNQAEPSQDVRGVIVAREISEDLLLACSSLSNVALYQYELAVTLRKIK